MLIAGEASGDLHGANLIHELKQRLPAIELKGMGGVNMAQAGMELIADIADYSVCGFVEIIGHLPRLFSLFKKIKTELELFRPDLLVLIDYPSFNLRLAKIASRLNLKILYYISPQLWAWHTSRISLIKKYITVMGVIFPFEADFYGKHNVPVKYVGHPLVGKVRPTLLPQQIKNHYQISDQSIVIGLLPGSRANELKYILPTLLTAAEYLQQKNPKLQFLLPVANTLKLESIKTLLSHRAANIQLITEDRYDAMSICDAVVAASGTVTLELALLGIPMVVVYKANAISFAIAKRVVKIPHISLCNIVAGEKIVEELIQADASPERICFELTRLIEEIDYQATQKKQLARVAQKLATAKECSIGQLCFQALDTQVN